MIDFNHPDAMLFFPGGQGSLEQLAKTTHLGIGAHQDDLEILAIHGILKAYDDPESNFTGVTVTDGRGAPRSGPYAHLSDDELWQIRADEQKKAAEIGRYNAQFLLNYPSSVIKSSERGTAVQDLKNIISLTQPEVIYTHNLTDKHDTHNAVTLCTIQALRELEPKENETTLYGCEVWRGLDWLPDDRKISLDVSNHPKLQTELLSIFDSQIAGGKRYDEATMGRRLANATYLQSHETDTANLVVYAADLTPLIKDPTMDITSYALADIYALADDVRSRLERLSVKSEI